MTNLVKKVTKVRLASFMTVILTLLIVGGCAPASKKVRVLWPPPPNQPKLEWVGTYSSLSDFPRSSFQKTMDEALGASDGPVFRRPFGIASDGAGKVYVSDADSKSVVIYDFNTLSVKPFPDRGAFSTPFGLAVDSKSNLYVVNAGSRSVLVFDPQHRPLRSFGNPDLLDRPVGVALSESKGRVYVSDSRGHRIVVFGLDGRHLFSFGKWGAKEGELYSPQGMAVDKEGILYVADMFNARVQVFDADGKFLRMFGERGDREWNFEMPKDIAIDSEGNLHITDARKAAMVTYRSDGVPLLFTGAGKSDHPLAMVLPAGIWIDANDRIYVADQMARRFSVWQYLNARYLEQHPLP